MRLDLDLCQWILYFFPLTFFSMLLWIPSLCDVTDVTPTLQTQPTETCVIILVSFQTSGRSNKKAAPLAS